MGDKSDKPVQFESLHLLPGHKLQIAFDGFTNERDRSFLLGYRHGHSLIVTTPTVNGNPISLNVGATLTVRSFIPSLGSAYAFRSEVLHILRTPYPQLYLKMPKEVVLEEVQSSIRAKVALQATVTVTGDDNEPYPVIVKDISVGGVGLLAKELLVDQGDLITLRATLRVNQEERGIELKGRVRTLKYLTQSTSVGIQFTDVSDTDQLLVYAYVLENLHKAA